jgi:integrase
LTWDDINFETSKVTVLRALVPQKSASGRVWRVEEPKTSKSRRCVPVEPRVLAALVRQRERQGRDRMMAEGRYEEPIGGGGFVFAGSTGQPLREDTISKQWQRTLARLNVPRVRLYDARHTAATLMLEANVPLKQVSDRLGHSSIMLTADVYTHVSGEEAQRATDKFAAYMAATDSDRAER